MPPMNVLAPWGQMEQMRRRCFCDITWRPICANIVRCCCHIKSTLGNGQSAKPRSQQLWLENKTIDLKVGYAVFHTEDNTSIKMTWHQHTSRTSSLAHHGLYEIQQFVWLVPFLLTGRSTVRLKRKIIATSFYSKGKGRNYALRIPVTEHYQSFGTYHAWFSSVKKSWKI